jgi:hypothetical protein
VGIKLDLLDQGKRRAVRKIFGPNMKKETIKWRKL